MKKFISKKAIAVGIAVISIVALLLTGTFAWFKVSEAKNEFLGLGRDVLLHDDYLMTVDAKGEIDKDVYAENTGNAPVIVRIKLQEYMDLTSSEAPANIDSLWQTHIPGASEAFHPTFTWNMGGQKNYLPGVPNELTYSGTGTREATLPATVITMAEYNALADKDGFVGWIYDTDGFAYWSQILQPGEATGLLLTSVTVSASIMDTDYYYAINVVMEAIDKNDLPMWLEGAASVKDGTTTQDEATDAGKLFLKRLNGIMPDWAVDSEGNPLTGTDADIGKTFEADGDSWVVIEVDDDGNLLILAMTATTRTHFSNNSTLTPAIYEGSLLQAKCHELYTGLSDLKPYVQGARTPQETSGDFDTYNLGVFYADSALSYVDASATPTTFPLSFSECYKYMLQKEGMEVFMAVPDNMPETIGYYWYVRSPLGLTQGNNYRILLAHEFDTLPDYFTFGFTTNAGWPMPIRPAMWINLYA